MTVDNLKCFLIKESNIKSDLKLLQYATAAVDTRAKINIRKKVEINK